MTDFIGLEMGDPDAEAPKKVVDAAIEYIKNGSEYTHYSHVGDTKTQRDFQEAAVKYYETFGTTYKPEQVLPTAGSGAALYVAMASALKQGDELLMWEPTFMGYYSKLKTMGVKPLLATLEEKNDFHPILDTISEKISSKTKAILLCNPNNPTGTVSKHQELMAIRDLAIDHDLTVIADEIYLHFIFDGNVFTSISSLEGMMDRTINVMSFSKTFSMTGWRLGYVMVPPKLLDKAKAILGMISANPTTFVHAAGAVALRECWDYVNELREEYDRRRKYFCTAVDKIQGLSCKPPEGGFYAWVNITKTGLGSEKFAERLAKSKKIIVTPGSVFGENTDGYIRVALVRPVPILTQAIERMEQFMTSL
jgi:aminotransferase